MYNNSATDFLTFFTKIKITRNAEVYFGVLYYEGGQKADNKTALFFNILASRLKGKSNEKSNHTVNYLSSDICSICM